MLALIKKVPQQWSHENERGKDIDVMFNWYWLSENINLQRIRGWQRQVMRQQACNSCYPKTSSQMCVAQIALELGPKPRRTKNKQCQSGHGRASLQCFHLMGKNLRYKTVSSSRHFFYLFQLPIHQRTPTNAVSQAALGSHCPSTHRSLFINLFATHNKIHNKQA